MYPLLFVLKLMLFNAISLTGALENNKLRIWAQPVRIKLSFIDKDLVY